MKEEKDQKTIVYNIYGVQFNECHLPDATFQTLVQGDMKVDRPTGGASPDETPEKHGDAEVREALATLQETTDEKGNCIFTEKGQWYAVYRVLSEYLGYPKVVRDFCHVMHDMGMDKASVPISYEAVKKIPQNVHLPSAKIALWSSYLNRADEKARKQIVVVIALMKLLKVG